MAVRTSLLVGAFFAVFALGCSEEDPLPPGPGSDAADTEMTDVTESDATPLDVVEDTPSGVTCGAETCGADQYCLVNCLCCGIDTGNPADHRTEYSCVDVPEGCADDADTCVADAYGCWVDGERSCLNPCA